MKSLFSGKNDMSPSVVLTDSEEDALETFVAEWLNGGLFQVYENMYDTERNVRYYLGEAMLKVYGAFKTPAVLTVKSILNSLWAIGHNYDNEDYDRIFKQYEHISSDAEEIDEFIYDICKAFDKELDKVFGTFRRIVEL